MMKQTHSDLNLNSVGDCGSESSELKDLKNALNFMDGRGFDSNRSGNQPKPSDMAAANNNSDEYFGLHLPNNEDEKDDDFDGSSEHSSLSIDLSDDEQVKQQLDEH